MNVRSKFYKGDIIFVVLLLVSIAALVNVFVLMSQYSSGTQEQAVLMASAYADDVGAQFGKRMDAVRAKTQAVASVAASYASRLDLDAYFNSLQYDDAFRAYIDDEIRYFCADAEYNQRGETIAANQEIAEVLAMRRKGEVATYGLIYDEMGTKPRVACYCPVANSDVLDGLLVYYPQEVVLSFTTQVDDAKLQYADLMAVCCQNYNGAQILSVLADTTGNAKINDSFYEAIVNLTNDVAPIAQIAGILETGLDDTQSMQLNGIQYILAIQRANPTDYGLYVIGLYKERTVYSSSYDLVETAIITMAILLMVLLVFAVYFVASRRRINKKIDQINMEDPVLQCHTMQYFEREAKQLLAQNRGTNFAVVVSHIQHYAYILEKYGETGAHSVLRHMRDVFESSLGEGETYGHLADGEFALLLHYRDQHRLENRLTSLYGVARKHVPGDGVPDEYDLKMLFGVYLVTHNEQGGIQKMVDRAVSVCDIPSRTDINQICHFYADDALSTYMRKAEIENRMEAALASGEFRVFYQPKYNLDDDRIDGAELLVRWYDPNTQNYRSPAEFLPVFEQNGFISKLDRHIYYTACETLAKWVAEGRRIFPISVNISRVTAIQPDFLTYYIKVKKHFNIADHFITLEFTESFAYENYEYLSDVAKELRKAGFLCAIDDFGTGYSTYNVLKLLDMDEIKLDKFFLDKGANPETDRLILDSVISMGKRMGLKVTQEGVETLEDLELLREEGCNVIQGYYFARPMSGNDYIEFIEGFYRENPILKAERALRSGAMVGGAAPDTTE